MARHSPTTSSSPLPAPRQSSMSQLGARRARLLIPRSDSPPPPQYLRFDAEPESNTLYLPVSRTSNAPAASSQSAVSRSNAPAASSQSAPSRSNAPAASSQSALVDHDVFGGGAANEKSYGGIGAKYEAYLHILIDPNEQGGYQNRRYHLTNACNDMFKHFNGRTKPCCMICRTSAYLPDDHHQDDCPDGYANRTRDRDFEALGSPELVLPDDYAACFGCHVLMSKVGGWHQGPMGKKCPNAHLLVKFFYVALTRPGNLPNILTSELIPAEVEDSRKPHLAAFRVWAVKQLGEQRGTLNLHVLALWFMDHHKIIAMDKSLYPLVVALKNQTIRDNADYARGQRKYDL
uniref:Helitron helicase-like domain-containing protein n=1 Tax=Mycena chlorophos TaxID=658473 RepID=A0ABQ0LA89_MYCCL|nr:predicted protein [Mycena chlorophos]